MYLSLYIYICISIDVFVKVLYIYVHIHMYIHMHTDMYVIYLRRFWLVRGVQHKIPTRGLPKSG